jgi:hypothetical protein
MNPGKQAKLDKANILSDAARMLAQLRGEAEKLKASNEKLRETIKDLKVSLYCFIFPNRISGCHSHVLVHVFNLALENASYFFCWGQPANQVLILSLILVQPLLGPPIKFLDFTTHLKLSSRHNCRF